MTTLPNTAAAIVADDISFTYLGENLPALDNISLTIPAGSCFGLLGPNGAGKSTLLAILTGILPLQNGRVSVHGNTIEHNAALHRQVALVPQDYAFYPTLTGRENLECFAGLYGLTGDTKRASIDFAVQVCGLGELLNRRAASCSGGVRRRVNLAIGLLNRPSILFLDEPTVGIDAQSRHFILESITRLQREGMTIIYTSHYLEEIQSVCDHLAIIDHGTLLLADSLAAVLAQAAAMPEAPRQASAQRLEDFYLSLTRTALRD
jgi:ABC-2 type transport system ATP-binding protein